MDADVLQDIRTAHEAFAQAQSYDIGAMHATLRGLNKAGGRTSLRALPRRIAAGRPNNAVHRTPVAVVTPGKAGVP